MKMSFQPSLSKSKKSTPKPTCLRLTPRPARMLRHLERAAVVPVQRGHLLREVRADDVQPAVAVVVADARRPCRPAPRRSRRRRSPPAPRSRGTCRRGCCDRTGSARYRTRRRCRASRRCRNRPPRRPFRTSRSDASCCSTNTIDEGPRGRAMPDGLRDIGKRPVAAIAIEDVRAAGEPERTARHRDLVVAAVRGVAGMRRASPDRSSRSWRRTDRGGRRGRSRESSSRRPIASAEPATPARSETSVNVPSPLLWYSTLPAPVADEQIVEAVVVVVADAAGLSPAGMRQARLAP